MLSEKEYLYCQDRLDHFLDDLTVVPSGHSAFIFLRSLSTGFEFETPPIPNDFDIGSFLLNMLKVNHKSKVLKKDLDEEGNSI